MAVELAHLKCVFALLSLTFLANHSATSPYRAVGRAAHCHSPFMRKNACSSVLLYCTIIHRAEHLRHKCPGEQWTRPYLCHMQSMAPSQEARHPILSLAAFTSAVLCRHERKRRCELDFDRGLGTQKNMMFYFLLPTSICQKYSLLCEK